MPPRRLPTTAVMGSIRFSAAPLWPGVFGRGLLMLAISLLAAGCGSVPFLGSPSKPAIADTGVKPPPAEPVAQPERQAARAPYPLTIVPPSTARPARATADPPDAVPRIEPISASLPNLQYRVRGQDYEPGNSDVPLADAGIASWYGEPFHGRRTANGEVYNMNRMTAAHKTMPLPSYCVVRNRRNGKEVVVRVNDRGPFKDGRVIDLSRAAARKLGISGLAHVELRRITLDEIRTGSWKPAAQRVAGLGPAK